MKIYSIRDLRDDTNYRVSTDPYDFREYLETVLHWFGSSVYAKDLEFYSDFYRLEVIDTDSDSLSLRYSVEFRYNKKTEVLTFYHFNDSHSLYIDICNIDKTYIDCPTVLKTICDYFTDDLSKSFSCIFDFIDMDNIKLVSDSIHGGL